MGRTVFVTGASTGIGRAAVERLVRKGFQVVAGVRKNADAPPEAVGHVLVDLTEPESVATACKELLARYGDDLVGLVNNAGISVNGPFEALPLEEWRRQFEVNLFGHLGITQELLPTLRRARGRVVNVGSIGGRLAMPFVAPYSASKFAMRSWTDALRLELAPHGVGVVLVEPGAIATPIWDKGTQGAERLLAEMPEELRERYGAQVEGVTRAAAFAARHAVAPEAAADVVVRALTARHPRGRYLVGADARLQALVAALPTALRERATRAMFRLPR